VTGRCFLDTNVLVYADDLDAGEKRKIAREILRDSLSSQTGVVSTQVLQEFFVNATRKLSVDPAIARRKVELLSNLDLVLVRLDLILGAINLHRLHQISFRDALILKCASTAGCTRLISEDMHHGEVLDGVRIENPFLG
jgi:predicted nucleic acid-binding protein